MMKKSSQVKLLVYEMHDKEIIVDSIKARSFDDFILVEVDNSLNMMEIEAIMETINQTFSEVDKQVLVVPRGAEIGFYGFREVNTKELSE